EFSREASIEFSSVLRDFVKAISCADFSRGVESLELPFAMRKALILRQGNFSPDYLYLQDFIKTGETS
ncbi:MAG TPA: hypothetical protein VLQ89_06075, partial [Candidatus Binatia bacterium]|nr:hypothetical protein [Candidatus Binatia bacterium]